MMEKTRPASREIASKNVAGRMRRSGGVGIVTAIFLLVVLSGIATAIVTFSTAQQQASALDQLGTRAYEAARSGIEYGLYQQRAGSCAPAASFAPPGTLAQMTVTVTCEQVTTTMADGTATLVQSTITATACNQPAGGACPNAAPGVDYVQRVVRVVL